MINLKITIKILIIFSTSILLEISCARVNHDIVYVDAKSASHQDGKSWETAYTNLQDAIDKAKKGDEIWVAAGIYLPTKQFAGEGDRFKSFRLKENVILYGGFNGSETIREERNWNVNKTILSGDLNGDDNDFDNNTENCYHVVTGNELDSTAVLDGFCITAGNANDSIWPNDGGGGMTNFNGSPKITNCTFNGNAAFADGGGIRNWGDSAPMITNSIFERNRVSQEGGGIMNGPDSKAFIANCRFFNNLAGEDGGGMYNNESNSSIINCVFNDNLAELTGGGMYNVNGSSSKIINCTFSNNTARLKGGGLSNKVSDPVLVNCILWGNKALSESEISNEDSKPEVSYSNIQGGYSGFSNINKNPNFNDSALRLSGNSPCIDAGDKSSIPTNIQKDLDLNPRIVGDNVDIGAFEYNQK